MAPDPMPDDVLARIEPGRREFIRKVIAGTAFAVPLMASFSMEGLALDPAEAFSANQTCSNQTFSTNMPPDAYRFRAVLRGAAGRVGACVVSYDEECPGLNYRLRVDGRLCSEGVARPGGIQYQPMANLLVSKPTSALSDHHFVLSAGRGFIAAADDPAEGVRPYVFQDLLDAIRLGWASVAVSTLQGDFSGPLLPD
jgi:hypothetical protein